MSFSCFCGSTLCNKANSNARPTIFKFTIPWLSYLGIVPEFRRRGLGRAMTLHTLRSVSERPVAHVTLSVDARNLPARRLYQALGFVETESNEVLLRFFD